MHGVGLSTQPHWRYLPLWLGGWTLLVVSVIWTQHLVPLDESRYVSVAWEMWLRGDPLLPYLNGAAYAERPPLLFWLIQLGWLAFGVNEWWPRLLPGLCSLGSIVVTVKLAVLLWPTRPLNSAIAGSLLLGCLLWALYTPLVMFDALLCLCVLGAILGLVLAAQGRYRSGWALAAAGLGLALLTSGLMALLYVLPVALLAPLWHPTGKAGASWYLGVTAMLLVALTLALLWAVPAAAIGGPGYARELAHNLIGRGGEGWAPWYYLQWLPVLLFPWLLWPPLWRAFWSLRLQVDCWTRMLLCWLLPTFLALAALGERELAHLLPLVPAFTLLASRALLSTTAETRSLSQWPICLLLGGAGSLILLLPELSLPASRWTAWAVGIHPAAGGVLLLLAAATLLPFAPSSVLKRVPQLMAVGVTTVVVLTMGVLGTGFGGEELRAASRYIADLQAAGVPVAHAGLHEGRFHFLGRLRAPLAELEPDHAVDWARRHPQGRVILYYDRLPSTKQLRPDFVQAFQNRMLVAWPASVVRDHPELAGRPAPETLALAPQPVRVPPSAAPD